MWQDIEGMLGGAVERVLSSFAGLLPTLIVLLLVLLFFVLLMKAADPRNAGLAGVTGVIPSSPSNRLDCQTRNPFDSREMMRGSRLRSIGTCGLAFSPSLLLLALATVGCVNLDKPQSLQKACPDVNAPTCIDHYLDSKADAGRDPDTV